MITTARLEALLREHWEVLGGRGPAPDRVSFLVVTKGREAFGKIVLLAFAGREPVPRFVVKLARTREHDRALEAEYLNLAAVAPHVSHGRVVAPRALFCGEMDGRLCLIETVVDGVELVHDRERSTRPGLLSAIVDWLIHLGRSTAHPAADRDDVMDAVAAAAPHVTTAAERAVLDDAADRLRSLRGEPIPRVFEQRDLGPWNVFLAPDGTLGVLDWESSRADGVPAWDLFYFLAHYGFMLERPDGIPEQLQSVRDTFLDVRGFGAAASAAVRRYATAMDLREAWLRPLFVGCWLHHAVTEVRRRRIRLSESLFWQIVTMTLARDGRAAPVQTR